MRRLLVIWVLALAGCKQPSYLDLKLVMACENSGPMGAPDCSRLSLECANRLEVRAYLATDGTPQDLLSARCVPMSELGEVRTLCDVLERSATAPLLTELPNGKTVMVRLRALYVRNPEAGCAEVPNEPDPVLIFDGYSEAVLLDGANHPLPLRISTCGSCSFLPPACVSGPESTQCAPLTCEPPRVPAAFPGTNCCPAFCKSCDDPPGTGCHLPPPPCDAGACPPNPQCPPGLQPLILPGSCCKVCAPGPPPR